MDFNKKQISIVKRNPFAKNTEKKLITMHQKLNTQIWYRAVVVFEKGNMKAQLYPEKVANVGDLNKIAGKLEIDSQTPVLNVFDAGFIEGSVGWQCNDCNHLKVDAITLYHSKCTMKDISSEG